MRNRILIIFLVIISSYFKFVFAEETIESFHLYNSNENGTSDWEVKGKKAKVFGDYVDIDNVEANIYNSGKSVNITAEKARLETKKEKFHLKDNVEIKNKEGLKLNTEYIVWEKKKNVIQTDKQVKLSKNDTLQIEADGMKADAGMKKVDFEKDVEVMIKSKGEDKITVITCDGPLEIDNENSMAVFNNNVVVKNPQGKLFADKAIVYFDKDKKVFKKIIAEGNVKIVKDENVTFADKATYYGDTKRIVLEGRPRLILFTKEGI